MKRHIPHLLLLAVICSSTAVGQISCTSGPAASKLVCEFPVSVGLLTNDSSLGSGGSTPSAARAATVFNSAIATQLSQLPLASASAGTVEVYKAGVPETFNNLGPILVDRAQVIGKGKIFLGGTASQYVFTDIDGIPLSKLAFGFTSYACSTSVSTGTQCPSSSGGNGNLVSTTYTGEITNLSFRMDQVVGVATIGLSSRVDMSVIVPVERVSLGAATISSVSYTQNVGDQFAIGPTNNPNTYSVGTASGVGDISFNAKGVLWSGERAIYSAGLTVRTPTGDDLNLLGSGAWGFNLYSVYSYLAKVSPHAKIGYQWNTTTELNNPSQSTGGNQSLPGGLQYDFGADWAAVKHLTVAVDALGSQYLNAPTTALQPISVPTSANSANNPTLNTTVTQNSSYMLSDLSTGIKWNPGRNLVLSANLLTQLINNGLRARPTPLLGVSYKF